MREVWHIQETMISVVFLELKAHWDKEEGEDLR